MCNADYTCSTQENSLSQRHRSLAPKWVAAAKASSQDRPPPRGPTVAKTAPAVRKPPGTSRPQPPTAIPPVYKPPRPPPLPSTMDRYRSEVIMAVQLTEPSIIPHRLRSSATASAARCLPLLPLPFPLPFVPARRPQPRPALRDGLICP